MMNISIPLFFRKIIKDQSHLWQLPFRYLPAFMQLHIAGLIGNAVFRKELEEGALAFLETKTLRIKVQDFGFDWSVGNQNGRLVFNNGTDLSDTVFMGNAMEFLLLATRLEDPDTLFFQRRLSIEGDTELGLQVKNLLDSIDVDELPLPVRGVLTISTDVIEAFNRGT